MSKFHTLAQGQTIGANSTHMFRYDTIPSMSAVDVVSATATQFTIKHPTEAGFTLTYIGTGMTYSYPGPLIVPSDGTVTIIRLSNAAGVVAEFTDLPALTLAQAVTTQGAFMVQGANDSMLGGAAADILSGGGGSDNIFGGAGNDRIFGDNGNDWLVAHDGDDQLSGGAGADVMSGLDGKDTFFYALASDIVAGEALNGGDDVDTIQIGATGVYDFRILGADVSNIERVAFSSGVVDATVQLLSSHTMETFQLSGPFTSNHNRVVEVTLASNSFSAANWSVGGAKLSLVGTAGVDVITGSYSDDMILGGAGGDTIAGGDGADMIFGGALTGLGAFVANSGADIVDGGVGNDGIWGMDGADTLNGGEGNDALSGGTGNDTLNGGAADDFLFGGDFVNGTFGTGSGNDTLDGGDGRDALYGFDGDDLIVTGTGNDYVEGGEGNDGIVGGAGNSFLQGGAGADAITGGAGFDYLYGGAGADLFNFRSGDSYDWVMDFSAAEGDRLRLDPSFGITSFAAFQAAIVTGAGFTQLTVNGGLDQITLFGVGTGQWTASMVEFA